MNYGFKMHIDMHTNLRVSRRHSVVFFWDCRIIHQKYDTYAQDNVLEKCVNIEQGIVAIQSFGKF